MREDRDARRRADLAPPEPVVWVLHAAAILIVGIAIGMALALVLMPMPGEA